MAIDDFLLEIGCEELPPLALRTLSLALSESITALLDQSELSYQEIQHFATPRRLAVLVRELVKTQPPRQIERQGPSVKAAYDKNGTPTMACLGFARTCGVSIDQLQIKETKKGSWVYCYVQEPGRHTADLLPEIVNTALQKLPIKKPMRWGEGATSFVRPVRWVVMLWGKTLIDTEILGNRTTREIRGHRFHHPKPLLLTQPSDYAALLYTHGMVMADYEKRKKHIKKLLVEATEPVGKPIIEEDLLEEVTAMVEWPVALLGQFKAEFLELPPAVLITTMKVHQRCFSVVGPEGKLRPFFVVISNIVSKNPQTVVQGNERVINARLADASFFYDNDLNHSLESRLPLLKGVVFQQELGNMADKAERLARLTGHIAKELGEEVALAKRAGLLAKGDLVSEMVKEFPTLQGVMGSVYAKHHQEPKAICVAIQEHYYPRFSGDILPSTTLACCIALADRLDILIGILGIHKVPTGDKDPFALRRAALGILRILIEKKLPLDLLSLLKAAYKNYTITLPNTTVIDQSFDFIMERLRAMYSEKGVSASVFAAVFAARPTKPWDFDLRIQAVQQFQSLPEADALTAANKRVMNLLKKETPKKPTPINEALFESDAERRLNHMIRTQEKTVHELCEKSDYQRALTTLSTLKEPIDSFFDDVMVMVENPQIRNNRIALLTALRKLFIRVADISLLS
ncbi:MAG: glycine--tRNA ligase subunit beta [Coxiella sp. RIFCSPHIGHO2_12_FULL_44_14]|nr:MAG: glycine--tRNA ligase subunit beta [Coxiella sp. RIFCSPHIGHO2_12_FULL_44_14]